MEVKTVIIVVGGKALTIHIAAVPAYNNGTLKNGFLAFSFKANTPVPTDTKDGFELTNHLFETKDEALKEGLKIAKAKIRHQYSLEKKANAKSQKKFKVVSKSKKVKSPKRKR
ncbi:MAG TPA: hypothetical protein VN026_01515 [Bacteroidia bacterium]|jgi:hypothetical protein|nr:hypothetical protein [Bacteroidia bacterium]